MLTVAGSILEPPDPRLPPPPPKLTPEQEARRRSLLESIRGFEAASLHKCETDDRSGPLVSGKVATAAGWVDAAPRQHQQQQPPLAAAGGGGRGPCALGSLFAGGMKPNRGMLKSSRGGGGGGGVHPRK